MRYAWINEHCDAYSVVRLCRAMKVSKSGFYRWLNSEPSPRTKRTAAIRESVLEVYKQSNCIYGSYKITHMLKSDENLETACRKYGRQSDARFRHQKPRFWQVQTNDNRERSEQDSSSQHSGSRLQGRCAEPEMGG